MEARVLFVKGVTVTLTERSGKAAVFLTVEAEEIFVAGGGVAVMIDAPGSSTVAVASPISKDNVLWFNTPHPKVNNAETTAKAMASFPHGMYRGLFVRLPGPRKCAGKDSVSGRKYTEHAR